MMMQERQSRPIHRKKCSYSQYRREQKKSLTTIKEEDSMSKIFRESSSKYLNAMNSNNVKVHENKYAKLKRKSSSNNLAKSNTSPLKGIPRRGAGPRSRSPISQSRSELTKSKDILSVNMM